MREAGSWYSYGTDRIGQGKENVREFLRTNPEIAATVEAQIRETLMPSKDATDDAADEEAVAQEA